MLAGASQKNRFRCRGCGAVYDRPCDLETFQKKAAL
jgi:hypothetical protein